MKPAISLLSLCFFFFAAVDSENEVKSIVRRQAIGGPGSIKGAGALDAIGSSLDILQYFLETRPGKCCKNLFDYCGDGTKGTPHCAYGSCNIQGCNCDDGCRTPADNTIHTIVFSQSNYNKGLAHIGSDRSINIAGNTCVNFGYYNDIITGVVLLNNKCVRIYEDVDCQGDSYCLCNSTDNLRKLSKENGGTWDDVISSMSAC